MSDTGGGESITQPTDLFDRWLAHHEGRPYQAPAPEVTAEAPVAASTLEPMPQPASEPEPAPAPAVPPPTHALPHTIFFKPRTGTRRLLGVVLLVSLAATVAAAAWAWRERSGLSYGIAGTAVALTLVVWATRAGADVARLTLHGSELEIVRRGSRSVFDLGHRFTPIEVEGHPGHRRWRVLFLRRGMSPYVVDASMVDPQEFMRVLRHFRPESSDRLA